MRRSGIFATAALMALLAGCGGGESSSAPPGSPDNPLRAKPTQESEGASPVAPSYRKLVDRQSREPRSRFTPCNFVTKAQALRIIGVPINDPVEAPMGPTCIYRGLNGKTFVTVAMPSLPFSQLKRQIREREPVEIAGRSAFCAGVGRPTLYVRLARGQVLSIGASCTIAARFAAVAVRQFDG